MNTAVINIKTDINLKRRAMAIADELGFSLSSLFNAYLRYLVRTKEVNFRLQTETCPTNYFIDNLAASRADIKAERISPAFTNTKKALKWLNGDH